MLRCDTSILLQRRCLPRTEGQHAALLQRLGNLLGIWKALAILFPQNEVADQWLHRPNDNFPFMGEPPLALMQFSLEGLAQVRRHLDARRGGWG